MKVLFTKDLKGQGKRGEVKEVTDGFANNFIIVQGYGKPADSSTSRALQEQAKVNHSKQDKARQNSEKLEHILTGKVITIQAKTSSQGKLFGGIKAGDISAAIKTDFHLHIPPEYLLLPEVSLREVGEYEIIVKLSAGGKIKFSLRIEAKDYDK